MHYNYDNIYFFVNEKEIYKFKADNKNFNISSKFCLGSICSKFEFLESTEVTFKGNVSDFSVHIDPVDKFDILNINKYSVLKNNIKSCSGLFKKYLLHYCSNESCMVRSTLIGVNPLERNYNSFKISLDKCNGNCNVVDGLSRKQKTTRQKTYH